MSIIVEDGSNVINANSYVTVQDVKDYASLRNITVSDDDDTIQSSLIVACDYIESKSYMGTRTYVAQNLSFPRRIIVIDGITLSDYEIPKQLKLAQIILSLKINDGIDLNPTLNNEDDLKSFKFDILEEEYKEGSSKVPFVMEAEKLLSKLTVTTGGSFGRY